MENKEFEELKEVLKKEDCTSELPWVALLLLLLLGGNNSGRISEEIKMKEDIAELRGKMSMIEKLL